MKTVRMSGDNKFVKWVKGSYINKGATSSDEDISESGSSTSDPNQQLNLVENFYDEKVLDFGNQVWHKYKTET